MARSTKNEGYFINRQGGSLICCVSGRKEEERGDSGGFIKNKSKHSSCREMSSGPLTASAESDQLSQKGRGSSACWTEKKVPVSAS
jgi:hypothetical protein